MLLGNHNHQANPHIHQQHIVWATVFCLGCPSFYQVKWPFNLIKAAATQTETSLLKQYVAGDCVDLLACRNDIILKHCATAFWSKQKILDLNCFFEQALFSPKKKLELQWIQLFFSQTLVDYTRSVFHSISPNSHERLLKSSAHPELVFFFWGGGECRRKTVLFYRKLALVGIIPNQILFAFQLWKRQKNCGFVAQWLERATRIRKTLGSIPGGCFFVRSGCQFFYLCRSWKEKSICLVLLEKTWTTSS